MLPVLLCLIVGVVDGDTLSARCDAIDGTTMVKVRLAEIDAPERRQPFGERSKQHLAALCFKRPATVRPTTRDRYGRTVARVSCAGVDASAAQVRAGMAWRFVRYSTDAAFEALEAEARTARRGLWSDAGPVAPWEWRRPAALPLP
jgi:endonuclease YncB( thermonuclease family)